MGEFIIKTKEYEHDSIKEFETTCTDYSFRVYCNGKLFAEFTTDKDFFIHLDTIQELGFVNDYICGCGYNYKTYKLGKK